MVCLKNKILRNSPHWNLKIIYVCKAMHWLSTYFTLITILVAIRSCGLRTRHVMCAENIRILRSFRQKWSLGVRSGLSSPGRSSWSEKGVFSAWILDALVGEYALDSLWKSQFHLSWLPCIPSGEGDLGGPSKWSWSFKFSLSFLLKIRVFWSAKDSFCSSNSFCRNMVRPLPALHFVSPLLPFHSKFLP